MGSSGDVRRRDKNVGRLRSENKAQGKLKEAVAHPLCLWVPDEVLSKCVL